MAAVLVCDNQKRNLSSFVPPPFEKNAVYGKPDVPQEIEWNEIDTRMYKASVCCVVTLKSNKADIWFTNPESNSVWIKLRVLDQNANILGETGLLYPGEYVKTLYFDSVPQSGETVELKIMAYEPETYYSAGSAVIKTTVTGGD